MGRLGRGFGFIKDAWKAWRSSISVERGLHEEQLEAMRRRRAFEESVEYREPFFFRKGDERPGCPACWQKSRNFVYLKAEERSEDGKRTYRRCPVCATYVRTGPRRLLKWPEGAGFIDRFRK